MKKQIIAIHGGDTFNTHEDWFSYLQNKEFSFERISQNHSYWFENLRKPLGNDFEVALPLMPNKQNSQYIEWKIWFEKIFPFIADGVILIGISLGSIFLAKYLAENDFPKKILATFLVCSPFDDKDSGYPLASFTLPPDISKLEKQGGKIFLYHSEDDPVVPFADFKKYEKALPSSTTRVFSDRGHFAGETLPEIVDDIKSLVSR